jgi:3-dehydroquinate synthase
MDEIDQRITVSFSYPVHFTRDLFASSNHLLRDVVQRSSAEGPARILFFLDSGVVDAHPGLTEALRTYCGHHRDRMQLAGPIVVMPGGEIVKNDPRHLAAAQAAIHDAALCRQSFVAAVGGGAILDLVGYAAATAHRGVRLIRIPTTVLAQDDSALGVKNGINAFGKKNYFGTFAPPFAVLNDFAFLSTLADRDWRAGTSEAVKAALIRDPGFFDMLERDAERVVKRDTAAMEQLIRRSAALHLAHIATCGDPFELGSSRPLDFGHWAAHKLEQLTEHQLRHGEAVAIGIALDTTYSYLAGFLPEDDWRRILDLLSTLGFSLYVPELEHHLNAPDDLRCVLRGLAEFQEHLGGRLTVMLLRGIGRPFDAHDIDQGIMIRSIDRLKRADEDARSGTAARKAS